MILIVGASTDLGKATARRLLAQRQRVRAMVRAPAKLRDLAAAGAEVVPGDLRDPASLARACAGVDGVLAAAAAFDSARGNTPAAVDDLGNRHLIDAARTAGVKRFVFTSVHNASATHPIDLMRAKYRAEAYLRASGLSYTILRPAVLMEKFVSLTGDAIQKSGKALIFGRGANPISMVSVEDVATLAVLALTGDALRGRAIEVWGPEPITFTQIAAAVDRALGRHSPQRHISRAMLRLMGVAARPFSPRFARMAASGYLMDTTDLRGDPSALLAEFPMVMTRLEAVAQRMYGTSARERAAAR
ncbi:MAG TPA: SDR family oxidoreductase [Ktedonobacterales bacterium]|nr:SDR family oxidoreductase [Ktedonobacterales bacterium]